MAGYLDAYGVDEARREKAIKWIILAIVGTLVAGAVAFLVFRNWGEKQRARQFFELLRKQDYPAAYAMWGCSEAHPCRDYTFQQFLEDWGPASIASQLRMGDTETCGTGLLVNLNTPQKREATLLVETATGIVSYAPWPECPEARFRFWKWIKMKFGRAPAETATQ